VRILDRGGGDLVLTFGGAHEKHTAEPGIWLLNDNLLRVEENKGKLLELFGRRTLLVLFTASR